MSDKRETYCAAIGCPKSGQHIQGSKGCKFELKAPAANTDTIHDTLDQRGANYGRFIDNATISEALMAIIMAAPGWQRFQADQKAATWIIMQKLSRALSGNPNYDDNWRDIAGYAQLIVDRINGTGTYATAVVSNADIDEHHGQSSGRCRECHAKLGDVHAPDCPHGQTAIDTRRGTGG